VRAGSKAPLPFSSTSELRERGSEERNFLEINGAVNASKVFVRGFYVTVCGKTKKAWKFRVVEPKQMIHNREFWLPVMAFTKAGTRYKLAPWFIPDRSQAWIFENSPVTAFSFSNKLGPI